MAEPKKTSNLHLQILTPTQEVFDDEIFTLTAPGEYGDIGVLPKHTNLLANLRVGKLEIILNNKEKIFYAVNKGFVEIFEDKIIILTETAEESSEINLTRARKALERARNRLEGKPQTEEIDIPRAKSAKLRAEVRISVSEQEKS